MKTALACLLLLGLSDVVRAQDPKPRAVPLFSNVEQGPAFMVECTNASAAPVGAIEVIQTMALRIDGQMREQTGGIAGSFLGGEPVFGPGARWRMMVGLRQGQAGTSSADFGAALRSPWLVPLPAGAHTIEFRCAGSWSEKVEFYWESASVPR